MNKVLRWLILIILFLILIFTLKGISDETKIRTGEENIQEIKGEDTQNIQDEINAKENKEDIQNKTKEVKSEYKGYKVVANLKIDKLKLDTCVLEDSTKKAMEVCVTKFFGPDPNEVGNFCIAGHNYITKNMFGYLYILNNGDVLTLTDNENGTIKYKIYDKYKVKPNQTYRLITKNKWEKRSNFDYLLQLF